MNILLVHDIKPVGEDQVTYSAVAYYRMQKPLEVLCRTHPGINYTTADTIAHIPDETLKQFDAVIFSRSFTEPEAVKDRLDRLNIMIGLDIDDYWHLPKEHVLADGYKKIGVPELIERCITVSGFITCTTEILADKIKPLNPEVYIIPNGIDPMEWQQNKVESSRVRFGFTGGVTHIPDYAQVSKDVRRALYDYQFRTKGQIVLCGFNADAGKDSIQVGYEIMLTDKLKALDKKYAKHLATLSPLQVDNKPYRRIWHRDIDQFHTTYDELDVVVAPLMDSEFNRCKSNIKMLEAGFKGCAAMVSGIAPYTPLATRENSFLLSEKNFFEWSRNIINNPTLLEDKTLALAESVKPYSLEVLSVKRKEIYESCITVNV